MINPKELDTDEKYFADKTYMSVSRFKSLLRCELGGLQEFNGTTEAMQIGSYVDSYISGTLEQFIEDNPDIISSRGATKGELKSGFKKAEEICEFIDNDKILSQFMQGDKQSIFTGEIGGVPFKAKLDIYAKGIAITDLKIMRSITNPDGSYYDFVSAWGYDLQLSVYQELVFQNTGERLPVYIAVVTKESPVNSAVIHIDQHTLDLAMVLVETHAERFYDLMTGKLFPIGCGTCKTCISRRNKTPIISLDELRNLI